MVLYVNQHAMGQIVCVASQKGGTGKTTTAVNIAASLALLEKHTLLVDCDPLGNATTGIGIDKGKLSHDLFDALIGRAYPREILVRYSRLESGCTMRKNALATVMNRNVF